MKRCTKLDEILHEHVLDNRSNRIEYKRHRSKVKITLVFVRFCLHDTRVQYLALSEGFTCFRSYFSYLLQPLVVRVQYGRAGVDTLLTLICCPLCHVTVRLLASRRSL